MTVCAHCQSRLEEAAPFEKPGGERRSGGNRSSAWILIMVGLLGILILALGIGGVIPLSFSRSYLFCGVMGAIFILFLVTGMVSMKNAGTFARKTESENSLRDTMLEWCRENLGAAELDSQLGSLENITAELLHHKRIECIKARLNHQFVNLDQDFLEKFIDDYIYGTIFEETEEREA